MNQEEYTEQEPAGWLWNTAVAETSTHLHSSLLPYTAIEILAERMASQIKTKYFPGSFASGCGHILASGMPDVSFLKLS